MISKVLRVHIARASRTLDHSLLLADSAFPAALATLLTRSIHLWALMQRLARKRQVSQALFGDPPNATVALSHGSSSEEHELFAAVIEARNESHDP